MRLIDADKLKKSMCYKCNDEYSDEPCEPDDCVFYNAIENAETVYAKPVVRCKKCGANVCQAIWINCCPRCGAKMDGDK